MSQYRLHRFLGWILLTLTKAIIGLGYDIKEVSHTFTYKGHISDFGDYNSNGQLGTLSYYVNGDVSTVFVFSTSSSSEEREPLATMDVQGEVAGVVGVDINMDGALDILVVVKTSITKYHLLALYQDVSTGKLYVGWNSTNEVTLNNIHMDTRIAINGKLDSIMKRGKHEYTTIYPLVLDINGDGLVDFLCQTEDHKLFVWTNCGGTFVPFLLNDVPFCHFEGIFEGYIPSPHSSAFVDIDGDCRADLVLLVHHENKRYLQIWQADADKNRMTYKRNSRKDIELPLNHGQVSFVDINGDGTIDVVVPYCLNVDVNGECTAGSNVAVTFNKQKPFCSYIWNNPNTDQCRKATELCTRSEFEFEPIHSVPPVNFSLPTNHQFIGDKNHPITLSFGDLNNNGYPDLIVLASDVKRSQPIVIVYENLEGRDSPGIHMRSFQDAARMDIDWVENCSLRVATLDLFEDGITEIGVFASRKNMPNGSIARFYAKVNASIGLFMKAMVKGLSEAETPSSVSILTKGSNVNGPTFKITVIDVYGTKSPRCSTIRPQSAYSPLLPPYSMFGLGKTNNYVEEFYLGMPSRSNSYSNMWISIIPNCSVIAVPFRLFYPNEWTVKLSLSPSKEIYKILLTTVICLASLGILIVGFDIKEKREDSEQEKGFRQKFIIN